MASVFSWLASISSWMVYISDPILASILPAFSNKATLCHTPCQAVVPRFQSVAGFIVAVSLHLYLPSNVGLGRYFAIVQLLVIYLHVTLTRPVDRVAPRHDFSSHCLEIWGGAKPTCTLFIGTFFSFSPVALVATMHFYLGLHSLRSRVSVVGIATGYGLDDWRFGVRIPVGSRIFCSPNRPDRLWGSAHPPIQWVLGLFPRA
jgi:hypothetical protein